MSVAEELALLNAKGNPLHISFSSKSTWDECKVKWWLAYYLRLETPQNDSAWRGNQIHDLAERYLKGEVDLSKVKGEDVRWEKYLRPGLAYVPTPETVAEEGWLIEAEFKRPCGPLLFKGLVDLLPPKEIYGYAVDDWKTTKFKEWDFSKMPSDLAEHEQPHVYAYAAFVDDNPPKDTEVVLRHINLQSRGKPDVLEVVATTTWDKIERTWARFEAAAQDMVDLVHKHKDADDAVHNIEPNVNSCGNFGGCPFADICPHYVDNRAADPVPEIDYSNNEKVMAIKNEESVRDRLRRIREKRGLGKGSEITPDNKPSREEVKRPSSGGEPDEVGNVKKVLDSLGKIPDPVLRSIAGDQADAAIETLGLVDGGDGNWLYGAGEEEPEVEEPEVEEPFSNWGQPAREYEAETGKIKPPGSKLLAGLIVPEDYEGSTSDAILEFSKDESLRAAAEALATVEEEEEEEEPEVEEDPKEKYDATTRKAARLIMAELSKDPVLDRGKASDILRAETRWKRVTTKRLDELTEAASAIFGKEVVFDEDEDSIVLLEEEEGEPEPELEQTPDPGLPSGQEALDAVIDGGPEEPEEEEPEEEEPEEEEPEEEEPEEEEAYAGHAGVPPLFEVTTIYLGCRPLGSARVTEFAEFLVPYEEKVEAELGVHYYGLGDFGKGNNGVIAAIRLELNKNGLENIPAELVIPRDHPLASRAVALFMRFASRAQDLDINVVVPA